MDKTKKAFDSEKYLKLQSKSIMDRINKFDNKLYLEFGGKLFDDLHASRCLPGFQSDIKVKLLEKLKDKTEIIFVISAMDIERNRIRGDFGITYDMEVLRVIDSLRALDLYVSAIVITLFNGQPSAKAFGNKLLQKGEKVYYHKYTKGYPTDVATIVSDEGYGANPYIETTRPLVVVTAPGPGSGKLGTCLSQLYHEHKKGVKAGYAKFETFPVWNLPLKHPLNVAYESATADLKDINMIDPFYFGAYGKLAINYNRDVEIFPVVKKILNSITKDGDLYKSPTEMGVNMVGLAITDDALVQEASKQEIIRRYFRSICAYKKGEADKGTADRAELLMNELEIKESDRSVVAFARKKEIETKCHSIAIELSDGRIATGRSKTLIGASAAAVLNALKVITGIDDPIDLIAPSVLKPILELQTKVLGVKRGVLCLKDVLIALAISAEQYPEAKHAFDAVGLLKGAEGHSSNILNPTDDETFKRLGINMTCDPVFLSKNLFES